MANIFAHISTVKMPEKMNNYKSDTITKQLKKSEQLDSIFCVQYIYLHWNRYWEQTAINGDIKLPHTPSWIKEYNIKLTNRALSPKNDEINIQYG